MQIPGLVVPPLTPFTTGLDVDYAALRRGVDYVVRDCDAALVVAAGVEAQEYQYLDLPRRRELISRTIEFVAGRRPVVVGVSHPSFRISVALAQFAEGLGAHAVQLLAPRRPFGGEPSTRDLERYLDAVAAETSLPLMLYLNAASGATVPPEAAVALASRESVRFVKESSRDLTRVAWLIERIDRAGLAHYFTTLQMMLISLQLGGSGVTLPPPAARLASLILRAFGDGDLAEAARLQKQFSQYPARWMHYGLAPTMKASLHLLGMPAGDPYPPYQAVTGADLDELRDYLATLTDLRLGQTFTAGMYACRPPGMAHGPWRSADGCLTFEVRYQSARG